MIASIINFLSVIGFMLSMALNFDSGSYLFSIFIALSFVVMICAFSFFSDEETQLTCNISVVFATGYMVIILLVYFAQLTTVRLTYLPNEISEILDFRKFGLFFNYDLLGYALMSLSTFFIGFSIKEINLGDKWLKWLLIIHGIFFISCFITPILGIFSSNSDSLIGIILLELWCLYFIPISILSYLFLKEYKKAYRSVKERYAYF